MLFLNRTIWLVCCMGTMVMAATLQAGKASGKQPKNDAKATQARRPAPEPKAPEVAAVRRAIEDLAKSYPQTYAKAPQYLGRLAQIERDLASIQDALAKRELQATQKLAELNKQLTELQRESLLANPLIDFDKLLLVRRKPNQMGLPQNWQGNCALKSTGYDNEIATLSLADRKIATVYRPDAGKFVGNLYLHWNGDRLLFSMPGGNNRWQIFEIKTDGAGLRQVTPGVEKDVDNYDPCYLPNGAILYASTAVFQGVPCVGGANTVANLFRLESDGKTIRQLCFDQDHNWCPTVMNDGRVLFTRWEYSDTPHYFSRLLFQMNPDGTGQMQYYGSNSYWPNSLFYARAIPNHPTKVVAIVSGHHGVARMGELVVLDPAQSKYEADGVVLRIPGYGKPVEPIIEDQLVNGSWPKFLHPYPLSEKHFIVASQPSSSSSWGIYLVDIFDNMVLLGEEPGMALLEPVALRKVATPPVIPDRVKPQNRDATVYLSDIYQGPGLKDVPRGAVKKLRLSEIYYCYPRMGGHINIGVQGPWDVHRILGTVPVQEDGSAVFTVPANTPISIQPLDSQGQALQVMRSWFTAMPGETVACVGCHERSNATPAAKPTAAANYAPSAIEPWYGPARGFSFKRDVQPVLDKYCVGCHDGKQTASGGTGGTDLPHSKIDFTRKDKNGWHNFTPSYLALHPYVRRPGPESDYHLQVPLEWHANTSELFQLLRKGHYNVQIDEEAWDRLVTWVDLNCPDHGTWGEHHAIPADFHERRLAMRTQYANRPEDPEVIPTSAASALTGGGFVKPQPMVQIPQPKGSAANWPFSPEEAKKRQTAAGPSFRKTIDLGEGNRIELVLIPAGEFVMGSGDGPADEKPACRVKIDRPFWMANCEISNRQYKLFDPTHNSGYVHQQNKDHTTPGYPANLPDQPAIRMNWMQAMTFCQWLSQRSGMRINLPTEAQWEWACRAGSDTPMWYGTLDSDFSKCENLADASITLLAVAGVNPQPIKNPNEFQDFLPKDARFNDGNKIGTKVGSYLPNPWGLHDMHGNVAEWTRSAYKPYPYDENDGRNAISPSGEKVVRGGSWSDRPKRTTSSFRLPYRAYQGVYCVGFRVVADY